MGRYITPAEATKILGISKGTITQCKKKGAPVRYIGAEGRHYLIDPDAWFDWMQEQGEKANAARKKPAQKPISIEELRAKRRASVGKRAEAW